MRDSRAPRGRVLCHKQLLKPEPACHLEPAKDRDRQERFSKKNKKNSRQAFQTWPRPSPPRGLSLETQDVAVGNC